MSSRAHRIFDFRAAVAALKYLSDKLGNSLTILTACKLLYFAEKTHLGRFGMYFLGDEFYALENGPVPTQTYDGLKAARGEHSTRLSPVIANFFKAHVTITGVQISVDSNFNSKYYLSESARECLDETIASYGQLTTTELVGRSHQDPAWGTARERAGTRGSEVMEQELVAKGLENAEEVLKHLASAG